jgi:transcription antitermination factor NusA-like protein
MNQAKKYLYSCKKFPKTRSGIILEITQSTEDYIVAVLKKIVPELATEQYRRDRKNSQSTRQENQDHRIQSNDEKVDPVGVMVGHRGDRINTVLSLLDGEKIDYIEYVEDQAALIGACLKPAHIDSVTIEGRKAFVKMSDDQKPLAIGKWAANIKLAGKLTGYMIEII